MKRLFSLFAALAVGWLAVGGEPPITVNTVAAVSSTQTKTVNAADKPIVVAVGRFVPLGNPKGEPLLFELSDPALASHVQIPAGGSFGGVPWDSADGKVLVRTFDVPTFILIVSGAGKLDVNVYGNGATTEVKDKDGKVTGKVQAPPVRRQTVSLLAGKQDEKKEDEKKDDKDAVVVKPGPRFLVVIEETADVANGRGVYWTNAELMKRLAEKGHVRRIADKDVLDGTTNKPPADLVPYLERSKGKKMPQLFVTAKDGPDAGTLLYQGDLPATPAALIQLLEKIGG